MSEENIFQKIAGYVGSYAPGIAGILAATGVGAPAAAAVAALGALAKTFGLPEEATHETILAAAQAADPIKLVQAEQAFQLASREQDIKELQAQLADVQSARDAMVKETQATGKRNINLTVMSWLGIIVAVGVFCITTYLSIAKLLDAVSATLIGNMTGIFLAKYSTVFDFWFGAGHK